jgi:hypothetical protein
MDCKRYFAACNERIMSYRALRCSRNDTTVLPGYDEQWLAKNTNASNRTLESLLTEFTQVRMSTVALFRGMSEDMMLRSGRAYTSEISALALGFVIVGHAIHHMKVLEQRYFTMLYAVDMYNIMWYMSRYAR